MNKTCIINGKTIEISNFTTTLLRCFNDNAYKFALNSKITIKLSFKNLYFKFL